VLLPAYVQYDLAKTHIASVIKYLPGENDDVFIYEKKYEEDYTAWYFKYRIE